MHLYRMLRPISPPIVIEINLNCLVLLFNAFREGDLDSRILREGDVRADIEEEAICGAKGCCMPAVVIILVVHYWYDALGVKAIGCAPTGHSRSQDYDVKHQTSSAVYFVSGT
jgi:hypothetical protein